MYYKFFFFLFLGFTTVSFAQLENIQQNDSLEKRRVTLNWLPTYKEALKTAKKEDKPVLVYFTGSDWCAPCIVLDRELFYTEKFKEFADSNLVLLEVDLPRNQDLLSDDKMSENLYLQKKFKVKSFPTLLFLNHRGRKIAEKKGYILTEYYFPYIQSIVSEYK